MTKSTANIGDIRGPLTIDRHLEKLDLTRYELSKRTKIGYQTIDYYKNKVVRYDSYVIGRNCAALDCDVSDIIAYESEKNNTAGELFCPVLYGQHKKSPLW